MSKKSGVKNKKPTVVLLDSHAILHRAYHALPEFSSSKGEPTGAIYGLALMIFSIIKNFKPDYVLAAFDLPEPTYRHEVYADYKAGRKKADEELVSQIIRAYDFYKAFNIPVYEKAGYEADDILGTLTEQLKNEFNIIIASGDMDTLQLVDGNKVKVFTLKKGIKDTILYDEKAVCERFGFGPEQLADYKGLRGDASDNIIGISGIGEKTATTLITQFGSIENIYKELKKENSDKKFAKVGIKERIQNLLRENEEEAEFSKMLATIQKDVPIKASLPTESWFKTVSIEKIQKLFIDLEFRSLSGRLKEIFSETEIEKAGGQGQLAIGENKTNYNLEKENNKLNVVDEKLLAETKVALWVLNSSLTNPSEEDVLNYTNQKDLNLAHQHILKEINKKELTFVFEKIEKPLIRIVEQMEKNGVLVDKEVLEKLSKEYHTELAILEKEIYKMSGQEFNLNSPQQLADVLFNKMQLKYAGMRKTTTGKFSTKENVLQKLKESHPIANKILEYREIQKLLSTYIDNIPDLISPKDGRLHATFLQTGTSTGRMSSNHPNLQNIPVGSERGRKIRKAFVPSDENVFISFDYSQIELRIAAILSGDEKMMEAFKKGIDIHTAVATEVFNVKPEMVTKEMRRQAKVINFGILYGMGISALKENLGSDRKTAQDFYNRYSKIYTGLGKYLEEVKKTSIQNGYTKTLFGRRRYIEGLNSKIPFIRAAAERMSINAPIQGTSADLIKLAMIKINDFLEKNNLSNKLKLILQIHDEIVYEGEKDVVNENIFKIKSIMESILTPEQSRGVPIITDYSIGNSWFEL